MAATTSQLRIKTGGCIDFEDASVNGSLLVFNDAVASTTFGSAGAFVPLAPGNLGDLLIADSTADAGVRWGVLYYPHEDTTADVTDAADALYGVTKTTSTTITLTENPSDMTQVLVKDEHGTRSASNKITIACAGSNTFEDGSTSKLIQTGYGSLHVYAASNVWYIHP